MVSMYEDERLKWKIDRISKNIRLSGDLSKYVGVTHAMLSMYENGKANMDSDKIQRYQSYIKSYPNIDNLSLSINKRND